MSKRGNIEFLGDIKEAIKRIETYIEGMNYEEFLQDKKTQDAVIRNLEIIGEAVKNISSDLRNEHKEVDWKRFAGMRDKIIHFYFGVNWDIVWSVVRDKLPEFKRSIENIDRETENL